MRKWLIPMAAVGALLCAGFFMWNEVVEPEEETPHGPERLWCEIQQSDTLRVGTIRSSVSAYRYKERWHGHEYDMVAQVASELGLTLDLQLMQTEQELLDSLLAGAIDLVAWPTCSRLHANREGFRSCGYSYPVEFRLLAGKPVHVGSRDSARYHLAVVEGSRPWFLFRDSAFLAGFNLKPFVVDTLQAEGMGPEKLVEKVLAGEYDYTLVASNIGQMLRKYYDGLYLGKPIAISKDSVSWMVSAAADTLAAKIDSICRFDYPVPVYNYYSKYFYQMSNRFKGGDLKVKRKQDGSLTGYDRLFVEYADSIGWDWRMLASLCMHESGCKNDLVSSAGAKGIMQIMPEAAARVGCPEDSLMDVRCNIRTASRMICRLERYLRKRIACAKDSTISDYAEADSVLKAAADRDLLWFTLAAYNAGLGQVFDAIALADTLGYDPAVWDHNVEHCLKLKELPSYYNLPCVHQGKFNASVTVRYVHDVVDMGEFLISQEVNPQK